MKQTAVEWLIEQLKNEEGIDFIPSQIIEQAKQMEKQQMIMFAEDYSQGIHYEKTTENYYNETFKK